MVLRQNYTVLNQFCQVQIQQSDPKPRQAVTKTKSPHQITPIGAI